MALEWGTVSGLAQSGQFDHKINDLRYNEMQNKRALAENEARVKMLADSMDFQNAMNDHDNPIVKEFARKKQFEIGEYMRMNPDAEYNLEKKIVLNQKLKDLKDNPDLRRGMASDSAYREFIKDLGEVAKDPKKYDTEAYDGVNAQWENYRKFGNQDGEEAAKLEGKKSFLYSKPQELINVTETLLKTGKNINNFNVRKGKDLGEYMTEPKPEEVNAIKNSLLKDHSRSIQLQARELGLNTPEQIDKWLTDGIVAGFEPKYSPGDPNALWERGMREREFNQRAAKDKPAPSNYSPFDDLFDPRKPAGNVPTDLAYKVWNETPKIKVVGNSGQAADLTGLKMNYDGRYMTDTKGRRYLSGFVNVPLDVATQNGLWTGDEEDGGISAAFMGKAVRRKKETKDGNGATYLKVDYMMPIDANDGTARQLYNSHAQPAKLSTGLQYDDTLGQQPKTVVQNGFTYTLNPNTGQYE